MTSATDLRSCSVTREDMTMARLLRLALLWSLFLARSVGGSEGGGWLSGTSNTIP